LAADEVEAVAALEGDRPYPSAGLVTERTSAEERSAGTRRSTGPLLTIEPRCGQGRFQRAWFRGLSRGGRSKARGKAVFNWPTGQTRPRVANGRAWPAGFASPMPHMDTLASNAEGCGSRGGRSKSLCKRLGRLRRCPERPWACTTTIVRYVMKWMTMRRRILGSGRVLAGSGRTQAQTRWPRFPADAETRRHEGVL